MNARYDGIITTRGHYDAEQIATIAADNQDLPGIAITTSWDAGFGYSSSLYC